MTDFYIGMLSGTSRDGVDLALVNFDNGTPRLHETSCLPYPPGLASFLKRLVAEGKRPNEEELQQGDDLLTDFFSRAVQDLLSQTGIHPSSVTAIGSHGQTVWHDPQGTPPETIQLGGPKGIATNTGITTVGQFRQADMAAGGQGAPLAPLLHRAIFQPTQGTRIVLNLGGIANISVIDCDGSVRGFDTGPANCLLDAWIQEQSGDAYDRNGDWSAGETVDSLLLLDLMNDPYFKKPSPKSTGVEYFNLGWVQARERSAEIDSADVQATLAQLTASTVASAMAPFQPQDVLVCGGGVHNCDLLTRLRELLPGCPVTSTQEKGIHPDCVEAVLFAWLARERLAERLQDTRSITGAREPVLLGEISYP